MEIIEIFFGWWKIFRVVENGDALGSVNFLTQILPETLARYANIQKRAGIIFPRACLYCATLSYPQAFLYRPALPYT